MGQYHYCVNLTKKEFIHPHQIGNGLKLYEQVGWEYATATALVMLLASACKGGPRGGGDFRCEHPLVGSWAGDRIAFIGDYAESDDIDGENAYDIYDECCTVDDHPQEHSDWKNISAQVREMMSAEFDITYEGNGWMNIKTKDPKKAEPGINPDLVITPNSDQP